MITEDRIGECSCIDSGVCSCEPLECFCDCGCDGCAMELDMNECPCGGNCGCSEEDGVLPNTDSFKDTE